jgi:hypothetical protein
MKHVILAILAGALASAAPAQDSAAGHWKTGTVYILLALP